MIDRYSTYKSSELVTFNEVPTHWNKNRIKYIGFMYGGLTGKSGDDFRMDEDDPSNKPFIPFTNICNNTYIKGSDLKLVSINEDDNQNRVEKDDLFFMMTSETQEDVGKTSVLKEDLGEVYLNTFCKGFRITDNSVNPYFLNYLLNGKPYRELLSVEGNGFTRINLRQDRVNDFVLFTPSITEQEQIVKYLDEKTTQIDQLISITEKKIEGLKEKRTSLINNVVTKGLDSNVEMKDSGVEWIGDIPKHWLMNKVKRNTYVKGRVGWKGLKSDDFIDEGPYLITGTDFKSDGTINWNNVYHVSIDRYEEDPFIQLKNNDILITKDGTIGKVVLVTELPGLTCLNSGVFVTRPLNSEYIPRFFFHILNSSVFKVFVEYNSGGSTILHLYQNVFDNFNFPIPPLLEQEQIVRHIDTQTTEIDNLISLEKKRIETLKEYRQSLISEVVTGKIRVCKEVSELQEN